MQVAQRGLRWTYSAHAAGLVPTTFTAGLPRLPVTRGRGDGGAAKRLPVPG
jgi:hypothetical protein